MSQAIHTPTPCFFFSDNRKVWESPKEPFRTVSAEQNRFTGKALKLKVCGMKYADNIREVAKLSPDFMGFIFYSPSPRFVGDNFQMPAISSAIKKVGVFVNERPEEIARKIKKYKLDFIQLHGEESPVFCKKISKIARVIKAFGIDDQFDFSSMNEYENSCEYFLFDTKTKKYGGSGKGFDKSLLNKYNLSTHFFLSGGIGLDKLQAHFLRHSALFSIDVNSKFEIEPGLKDIRALKTLKNELSGK